MHAHSSLFVTVLSALTGVVTATPPGCLLGAINTQPNPTDFNSICGTNGKEVQKQIANLCDDGMTNDAISAYTDTCKGAGKAVSIVSISPSATGSVAASSGTGAATVTASGSRTSTTTGSGSSSGGSSGNSSGGSGGSVSNGSSTGSASGSASTGMPLSSGAGKLAGSLVAVAATAFGILAAL